MDFTKLSNPALIYLMVCEPEIPESMHKPLFDEWERRFRQSYEDLAKMMEKKGDV